MYKVYFWDNEGDIHYAIVDKYSDMKTILTKSEYRKILQNNIINKKRKKIKLVGPLLGVIDGGEQAHE